MEKYVLRDSVTGSQMENLGLPIGPIIEHGVIYLDEKDSTIIGDDQLEHHYVIVNFVYKDSNGNNHEMGLIKNLFENLFEKQ